MSRLLLSASPRPLVKSGTAVTPPVPVLAVAPAPVRWNATSIVNVLTPRLGAAPKVT
jgi:hypothetical protein